MNNLKSLYITPIFLTFKTSTAFELNGAMGDTLRRCLETTFKRIDDGLAKRNPEAIPYFRGGLSEELINRFPDLKDFSTPPRGYSVAFSPNPDNDCLLHISINLFGRYAGVLPLLLPRLPTLMDTWFKRTLRFNDLTNANGEPIPAVADGAKHAVALNFSLLERAMLNGNSVRLHFLSPTMLNNRHNEFGDMHFGELITAIYRRADVINRLYCNGELASPFTFLNEKEKIYIEKINLEWVYSPSVSEGNPILGYVGYVEYKGDLAKYLPLLLLGQWLQVGKKTNYGAGQYLIANECYTFV